MLNPRFLLFGFLLLKCSYEAYAFECSVGGLVISCPTIFEDSNKVFCCKSDISTSVEYCCEAEDYLKQNSGILAGIIVGALLLLLICTLCCCCFCSCCWCAKRRLNSGRVLYGPLGNQVTTFTTVTHGVAPTPVGINPSFVHVPPPSQQLFPPPPPPAYYPPTDQDIKHDYQPPQNPGYQ